MCLSETLKTTYIPAEQTLCMSEPVRARVIAFSSITAGNPHHRSFMLLPFELPGHSQRTGTFMSFLARQRGNNLCTYRQKTFKIREPYALIPNSKLTLSDEDLVLIQSSMAKVSALGVHLTQNIYFQVSIPPSRQVVHFYYLS